VAAGISRTEAATQRRAMMRLEEEQSLEHNELPYYFVIFEWFTGLLRQAPENSTGGYISFTPFSVLHHYIIFADWIGIQEEPQPYLITVLYNTTVRQRYCGWYWCKEALIKYPETGLATQSDPMGKNYKKERKIVTGNGFGKISRQQLSTMVVSMLLLLPSNEVHSSETMSCPSWSCEHVPMIKSF